MASEFTVVPPAMAPPMKSVPELLTVIVRAKPPAVPSVTAPLPRLRLKLFEPWNVKSALIVTPAGLAIWL